MKIWKMMAHHEKPLLAFQQHVERGYLAVGWNEVDDLRKSRPVDQKAINALLKTAGFDMRKNPDGASSLWRFYALMSEGDLVIDVARNPGTKRLGVFRVTGPYEYLEPAQRVFGYPHGRRAELTTIEPDELWAACGGGGASFAEDEPRRGVLAALRMTDEARHVMTSARVPGPSQSNPGHTGSTGDDLSLDDDTALNDLEHLPLSATEKAALAKIRIQQSRFRTRLLERWAGACSVSGLTVPQLLIASHIFPWAKCETAKDC